MGACKSQMPSESGAQGRLIPERVISLAGSGVKDPRLVRTLMGASTNDLVRDAIVNAHNRSRPGTVRPQNMLEKDSLVLALNRFGQMVDNFPNIIDRQSE